MFNLSKYISILKNEKKYLISIFSTFFVGMILGLIIPKESEKLVFNDNGASLFFTLFTKDGNIFLYILSQFFSNLFYLAIFTICAFSLYLLPVQFLLILYKGYIVGALLLALIGDFGISGFVAYLFAVFLHSLIICFSFAIFSTFAKFSLKACKSNCDKKNNFVTIGFIFCAVVILLSAILLLLIMAVVVRPLNYVACI